MGLVSRAVALALRTARAAEPRAVSGIFSRALPQLWTRKEPPTLREFLTRRLPTSERIFETRGDVVAHAEAQLCRQLLATALEERALAEALHDRRRDGARPVRNAAQNLWSGWIVAGGRPPIVDSTVCEPSGNQSAPLNPHPRHSTGGRLRLRRSSTPAPLG